MYLCRTRHYAGLGVAMLLASTALAPAQEVLTQDAGTIEVRLRALAVIPETSSTVTVIGGHADASTSVIPELDGTYFITPNWAVEEIAGVTQHDIHARKTAIGTVDLGSVWLLPPTLTLQYHYQPTPSVDLYGGAGINYTFFLGPYLPPNGPAKSIGYDNNVGAALQFGLDWAVSGPWVVNFDVKQLFLNTTTHINGAIKASVSLDPTLIGVGVGYRF